jgi:parvulin-like peptidyl-prolyl isomerase
VREDEVEAQTYAWNWFALHAGQRLQLVNFWLVAVAFFATAFVQAISSHRVAVAVGVSLTGTIASIAFMRLDRRTRQLVQAAESALRHLEASRTAHGIDNVIELVSVSQQAQRSWLDSYRTIIQGLQLLVAILFAVAAVYALISA